MKLRGACRSMDSYPALASANRPAWCKEIALFMSMDPVLFSPQNGAGPLRALHSGKRLIATTSKCNAKAYAQFGQTCDAYAKPRRIFIAAKMLQNVLRVKSVCPRACLNSNTSKLCQSAPAMNSKTWRHPVANSPTSSPYGEIPLFKVSLPPREVLR